MGTIGTSVSLKERKNRGNGCGGPIKYHPEQPAMRDTELYEILIDGVCARTSSELISTRHSRFDVTLNGTPFSLVPSPGAHGEIDAVAFFAEVGTLPEHGRAEAAVGLLESNLYLLGPDTPRYCCNPERPGLVVMAGRMPLKDSGPDAILHALTVLAEAAADARDSFSAQPASAGESLRGATTSRNLR